MTVSNISVVFYTISFLVPGFVMNSVISAFQPQKELEEKSTLLKYLTLSSINYSLCSWLIFLISQKQFIDQYPKWAAFFWFAIVFVSPVMIGTLIGISKQREWTRRLLQKIGIVTIHSLTSAWDYIFSRTEPGWILVTLKDGSTIGGWFGSESFAASKTDGKDLYIQEIYRISDGTWQKLERKSGIWIDAEQIKHTEFIEDLKGNNNEKEN